MDMPIDVGNNQIIKDCLSQYNYSVEVFDTFDFSKAASCFHKQRAQFYIKEVEATRDFLDANPQYRIPGGSHGNVNPCWGRNKSYLTRGGC